MSQFQEQFFHKILSMEGGYQANASDAGNYACDKLCGTKFGIAASSYQTYTKKCPTPEIMKGLTEEFAMGFYQWYGEFWRLDEIEDQDVYELVFNNFMGLPVAAARSLQKALNRFGYALEADGNMGSKTLAALNNAVRQNKPAVYNGILEEWVAYLNLRTTTHLAFMTPLFTWTTIRRKPGMLPGISRSVQSRAEGIFQNSHLIHLWCRGKAIIPLRF